MWSYFDSPCPVSDVTLTCFISEECVLPCSFEPASGETIKWSKQDLVVYKFERDDEDDDDDDEGGGEEHYEQEQLAGRASVFPHLISRGNATLILRRTNPKDRGTYRCHVHTSKGDHNAKVIVKVEAPIRALSLELTRLSGYEEMKCTARNVFPAPRVTWATEPPTFEDLRPVTRIQADKQGLYMVDSRLRRLEGQPDLIYICRVTTSYGGPVWTASLREREIRGSQGRDITIPCFAPPYLNNPYLHWTFSNSEDPLHILQYDSYAGNSITSPPWDNHVELIGMVVFGDGSLRLMDPKHSEHTGSYTCSFSVPYNTHTERTEVTIEAPIAGRSSSKKASHWWIFGLVIAGLVLTLVGVLAYKKLKGRNSKPRNDPEEVTELHSVKDPTADSNLNDSSPLTAGGTNGQTGPQTGAQLT
ncbi:uncharacterized protein hhla2b.1 [Xyrichtys novacula]|uniref:Uncharacterized protein hhla2b.1 n=1 Tax=Xyrichtys novacula TaxID=13765 RepID=A0AAV1H6S5_XYRNO|nr:uncharacterized protein hhla2b.1 [Xyrichtys novacula]